MIDFNSCINKWTKLGFVPGVSLKWSKLPVYRYTVGENGGNRGKISEFLNFNIWRLE